MNYDILPTDQLQPVGLDSLNQDASLLTRKDRKYVVPLAIAKQIITQGDLQVLEIDGLRSFRYESVYFDTSDRVSYFDAAHKRRLRFKVRTRSYVDSGMCSLEVKTRQRRGLTQKHRLPYDIVHKAYLDGEAQEFLDTFEAIALVRQQLSPVLTTQYARTTLLEARSGSRITIDTNLKCTSVNGSAVALHGLAIVETKTPNKPCETDRFLWARQQRPTKISKFCTGLAATTPGLPANKWNRVLRTHFGWQPSDPVRTPPTDSLEPNTTPILKVVGS